MSVVNKIFFNGNSSSNLLTNIKSSSSTTTYSNSPIMPIAQWQKEKQQTLKERNKKITYASAAIALASLGLTTLLAVKNRALKKQVMFLGKNIENISSEISTITENFKKESQKLTQSITDGLKNEEKRISDLGKWQDGVIEGVKNGLNSRINQMTTTIQTPGTMAFKAIPVNINGVEMQLGTVVHGYGKYTEEIEQALQSESTKRIFGMVSRSATKFPEETVIRIPTSEFKGFTNAGGMSVVPRDIIANLGALINGKQKVKFIVDTPMYLGQVQEDVYYSIKRRPDGLFEYISSANKKPLAILEKIDEMNLPIYTDIGKTKENVEIFISRGNSQKVDYDLVTKYLDKNILKQIKGCINKNEPFEIKQGALTISYNPTKGITKPYASVEFDTVLYKNDKFRMDGPVFDGENKTIYNNFTHESGETERFIYFDKFFYEHLMRNGESCKEPLKADLIIGNDWQTGGITAMIRLLSIVKSRFGTNPEIAQKLYNTPVLTIMHNAGLAGSVSHSQAKLLNILFGEHAGIIAKNAYMPKGVNLNPQEFNALFHGDNFNPQTMAVVYSDIITPVSKGYGHEMAAHSGFGSANHNIFRMRGRYHEFEKVEKLESIAKENGIDPANIPKENISYRPITNGSDRVNNLLTEELAASLEQDLNLKKGSLWTFDNGKSALEVHNHNKSVYLEKLITDTESARKGGPNPFKIELADKTDLSRVNENTMVVTAAGRIEDQKGLEILAQSIEEFLERHYTLKDSPLFYVQGIGKQIYIDQLLAVKNRIAIKYGQKVADRIVFARVFDQAHYNGCKLMSDFIAMSSWFEPCGLVHKQVSNFSGAIPIINKVGGLPEGLTDGVNAIFSEFRNKFENYNEALSFNRKAFADALDRAYELFKNKRKFAKALESSLKTDHSWLKSNGPIEEYAKAFVDLKVLSPEVLQHS